MRRADARQDGSAALSRIESAVKENQRADAHLELIERPFYY